MFSLALVAQYDALFLHLGTLASYFPHAMKNAGFWTMILGGVVMVGAPVVGVLGVVLGMVRSFAMLEEKGVADPRGLAENVSSVLSMSVYGFFISVFGAVVFFIGLGLWASAKSKRVPPPMPGA